MSRADVESKLYACFASRDWAEAVAAGRPYADLESLLGAAEAAWSHVSPSAWLAALAAHPRIGEKGGHAPESSELEQSGVRSAPAEALSTLAEENRRYESRFGHVFLISASGRTSDDILAALRQRLGNDPETELRTAADELRKITRIRLERLIGEIGNASPARPSAR